MVPYLIRAIDFLFPMVCLCCEIDIPSPAPTPICAPCQLKIKPAFPQPPKALDALYCAGVFEGNLRELIHSYKYKGKEYLADFFLDICLSRWSLPPGHIQAITVVPLPFWRSVKRGFNPPGVVAGKLSRKWGVPFIPDMLRRRGGFPSQTHLNRVERRENAARSFCVKKTAKRVEGGSIFLMDDVLTTGATLSACGNLLRSIGFERVIGGVIAFDPLLPNKKVSATIRAII